jgi:hypothetical protein
VLPLVIVFAVIAVAAGVWAVMQSQAAASAKVRTGALDERIRALEAELATASDKVAFAEQAARQSEQRAIEHARRIEAAEHEGRRSDEMAEDAVKRAIAAERIAADAATRAQAAEAEVVEARRDRDATLAKAGPFQPEALWALEVQRIERLWRDRLCLQPGEESPLVTGKDVLGEAVRILSDASREESGVVVDLMWHVDFDCPPDRRVQLVRLAEELIAAMRESEGGELEVIGEEDRTVFFLVRTLPPIQLPASLVAVLDDFGAMREIADTTVVVRVPARDDAKLAATEAAAGTDPAAGEGQQDLFGDDAGGEPVIDLTGDDAAAREPEQSDGAGAPAG